MRTQKFINSLSFRVAVLIAVVLLICFSLFTYFARRSGLTVLEDIMHVKADAVSRLIKISLYDAMLNKRPDEIANFVSQIYSDSDILDLRILTSDYKTKWGKNKEAIEISKFKPDKFSPGEMYYLESSNGLKLINVLIAVPNEKRCQTCHKHSGSIRGYIYTKVSMHDIQRHISTHQKANYLMIAITLLVVAVLSVVIVQLVVIKPVNKFSAKISQISSQIKKLSIDEPVKIESRAEKFGVVEIDNLVDSFNDLIDKLNTAYLKLKSIYDERMKKADRMINVGQIAAGLAHEIKNPISGTLSALQIAINEFNLSESEKEILKEMRSQLMKVDRIIRELLQFARPKPLNLVPVEIVHLLARSFSLLEPKLKAKKIKVNVHVDESIEPLNLDPDRIQQVIVNILLNAIDAVKKGGEIKIELMQDENHVKLSIQDNGPGIPRDELEKIFEPFYTTKPGGTGLGLAICKQIIESHNGKIEVKSEQGKGSTFIILLPKNKQGE